MTSKTIWYGFHLDDDGVPQAGAWIQDYSVDPWHVPPDGYVSYKWQQREYMIAADEVARIDAKLS